MKKVAPLSIAFLYIVSFCHSQDAKFHFSVETGLTNNFGLQQKKVRPVTRFSNTPDGFDTLNLSPKVNPLFFRKGNTGGRCFRNSTSSTGGSVALNLGVDWDAFGISTGAEISTWGIRNFYYTDNPKFPHFMEENKITSIGVPLKIKFGLRSIDFGGHIVHSMKVNSFGYLKFMYHRNIAYSNAKYIGGEKYSASFAPHQSSQIRDNNFSVGLGINFAHMFFEYNFFPRYFLNTASNTPFSNLPKTKSIFRGGINYNPPAAKLINKIRKEQKEEDVIDIQLLYRMPVIVPERYISEKTGGTTKVNSPQGLVDANLLKGNPEEPYSTCNWNLGNWRLLMLLGRKHWGTTFGIDHSNFKRQNNYIYASSQNTFITSSSSTSISAFGIFGKIHYNSIGIGIKGDFLYRTKTIEFWGDDKFNEYIEFIPPGTKKFTYSILFSAGNIEFQFFPQHFVNKEYVNKIGLTPFSNSGKSAMTINLGVPICYLVDREDEDRDGKKDDGKRLKLFDYDKILPTFLLKKQIEDSLNSRQ